MTRTTTDALQRLKTQRQKLDARIQHHEAQDTPTTAEVMQMSVSDNGT